MRKRNFIFLILSVLSASCSEKTGKSIFPTHTVHEKMRYTDRFGIADCGDSSILYYLNGQDTFRILSSAEVPGRGCKTAILSSVFAGFALALDASDNICAVDNIRFYYDDNLQRRHQNGNLPETGEEMQLRHEIILGMAPCLLIGTDMLYNDRILRKKFDKSGVKLMMCDNYKEQHPLARAEWIKFFGFIYNKRKQADSIFNIIESSYLRIAREGMSAKSRPDVLTDAVYMDAWNVPGGLTYTARLINDAGANYVFSGLNQYHTYPLGFEKVLRKASDAQIWLHVNRFRSRREMENEDRRYKLFKAFKKGRVYNNNKRERVWGANDFWESGVVRPDLIISDIRKIITDSVPAPDSLYYYRRLD